MPGAFTDALERGLRYPVLLEHQSHKKIGSAIALTESDTGLHSMLRINTQKGLCAEVINGIKGGFLTGLSIGYRVQESSKNKKGHRLIHSVDLIEISVVAHPANTKCRITKHYALEDTD